MQQSLENKILGPPSHHTESNSTELRAFGANFIAVICTIYFI
jgi:hypothetical protein